MKFVNATAMTRRAREQRYAVPAFNTNGANYDITRAALEAAQEAGSPLILQAYEPNLEYRGMGCMVKLAAMLCDELGITVPVALNIDHGHTLASAQEALAAGFTSFMIDASHETMAENIRRTNEVARYAHQRNASVEAEIGYVAGNEKSAAPPIGCTPVPLEPSAPPAKTTVAEVLEFTREADVDMLAVAVGTCHGVFERQHAIDFALLAQLRDAVDIPLVQHGTCGISRNDLRRLAQNGMSKVNFGEPFRYQYIRYFQELTDGMAHCYHPWRIEREIKNRLKRDMLELIDALGSAGKA